MELLNEGAPVHSPGVWSACVSCALVVALSASGARAAGSPGVASDAEPGLYRVGIAEVGSPAIAGTIGYGYTEKQASNDGAHHRLSLRAAAALPVLSWLSIGPIVDGRYDIHLHDAGTVLDVAALARASFSQGPLRLGAELRGWLPGAESAGTMFRGASLDSRVLLGGVWSSVNLASTVGFRLDRTSAAGENASLLGPGDRWALGLSDFNAVLLGLGAGVPLGRTELLTEASAELLVGPGAPSLGHSPIRLAGGARHALSDALSAELLAVFSLSQKPDLSPGSPLVPNEPRVSALAGVRYRFLPSTPLAPAKPSAPTVQKPAPAPPPPKALPTDASIELTVHDEQGSLVGSATAAVTRGSERYELVPGDPGLYRHEHVLGGGGTLRVEARGFQPLERPVTIQAGVPLKLDVVLTAVPPPSQVRGLIRSLSGQGIVAKIRVEPTGVEAVTDAGGAFQVDLAPGSYDVVIEAPGYATQRRHVSVEPQGVVILNAELARKR